MANTHLTRISLDRLYTLDPHDDLETNDDQRDRMKRYIDAVMDTALTERQRQVVWMYHGDGMKTPVIAAKLGINSRVVQRTLKAAMLKLQQHKKIFLKSDLK